MRALALLVLLSAAVRPAAAEPPQGVLRFLYTSLAGVDCAPWGAKADYLDAENAALAERQLRVIVSSLDGQQRVLESQIKGLRHSADAADHETIGRRTAELWTVRAYRTMAFVTLDGVLADLELPGRESPGERAARKTRFCRRVQSLGLQIKAEEAATSL